MKFKRLITTIDGHAEGAAKRVVVGGLPNIPGKTMSEKRDFVKQNLHREITSLISEPRGHKDKSCCILTPPVTDGAAFGVLFVMPSGYIDMCGSGSIVVATIAVETGMVEPREPVTELVIDTPAGPIYPRVNVEDGRAKSVTLENVPSFPYKTEVISVPEVGELTVDIAYGGNFYAVVEAKDLGIVTKAGDIMKAMPLITKVKEAVIQKVEPHHPEMDYPKDAIWILLSDKPTNPEANVKNILVTAPVEHIDRSPCGTGTSARMAILYFKGELGLGETFVTESVTGTLFWARPVKEVSVGGVRAIVPEVTGRGFITGMHYFVMDEDDPFKYGLSL